MEGKRSRSDWKRPLTPMTHFFWDALTIHNLLGIQGFTWPHR
jgi:hypothetical protein